MGPPVQLLVGAGVAAVASILGLRPRRKKSDASDIDVVTAIDSGPVPVGVEWRGITCEITGKKGKKTKILDNVSGSATPGRFLAIMGPSGSGKTTLLNSLAGQLPRSKGVRVRGRVAYPTDASQRALGGAQGGRKGYVTQDDAFFSQLTVRETLTLAAQLSLKDASPERVAHAVDAVLHKMGLVKCADTRVGNNKVRGVSGGERKRLAVAAELLAAPSLLFLDEPTTGLDAFQAQAVAESLRQLSAAGHTVITSIHQPRSSTFALFDDLLLLADGRVAYLGPARAAPLYFASLGLHMPEGASAAEWLIDTVSVDYSSAEAEAESRKRIKTIVDAWGEGHAPSSASAALALRGSAASTGDGALVERAPLFGFWKQFRFLAVRAWRQVLRDKAAMAARAGSSVFSALVFVAVYWRLGRSQAAIQSRTGLLQVCAVNAAMSSVVKTLGLFPKERVIVQRERAKGAYDLLPYFVSKLAAELPTGAAFPLLFGCVVYPCCGLNPGWGRFARFLGIVTLDSFTSSAFGMVISALAPSAEAAMAIGPATMVIWIVFGGVFVNETTVPKGLRFLPKLSLIKCAFEALCVNDLKGLTFDAEREGDAATGEQVLRRLAFENGTVGKAMATQAEIMLGYYALTYWILRRRRAAFARIEEPEEQGDAESGAIEAAK